jgi:hypothetical protein
VKERRVARAGAATVIKAKGIAELSAVLEMSEAGLFLLCITTGIFVKTA